MSDEKPPLKFIPQLWANIIEERFSLDLRQRMIHASLLDVNDEVCMSEQPQNARDTQFAGFAKLLINDLMQANSSDDRAKKEQVIARRAYDLVKHTIRELQYDDDRYSDDWTQKIPDMTEWKKECDSD